jgi:hypothetical protein
MRLDLKNKKQPITKRPGGVAQGEALTSNPSTAKKKKKKKERWGSLHKFTSDNHGEGCILWTLLGWVSKLHMINPFQYSNLPKPVYSFLYKIPKEH